MALYCFCGAMLVLCLLLLYFLIADYLEVQKRRKFYHEQRKHHV